MSLRVLIVDDEPLAREGLRDFLSEEDDVEVVGEARSGDEALRALEGDVDLVLLDVQMPGKDGFEVLEEAGVEDLPAVIFVTAYDEYAVRAFDIHAVDYLLKPVRRERFRAALRRAREHLEADEDRSVSRRLTALLRDVESRGGRAADRMVVKSGSSTRLVRLGDIDWIEAADNYATLHTREGDHMIRTTMTALEKRLDSDRFVRIHRSYIVNLDRVREIRPWDRGDHLVLLADGTKLSLTRTYRKAVEERLGREL